MPHGTQRDHKQSREHLPLAIASQAPYSSPQMTKQFLTLAALLGLVAHAAAQTPPQLAKNSITEVVAAMSLEEKARLVVGPGMRLPFALVDPTAPSTQHETELQGALVGETQERVPGAAGVSVALDKYGIPSLVLADGPAGLRISPQRTGENATYYATAFPIASLLAASWNTELTYKVGQAMGDEATEYGVDVLLAPGMNIHRNALNGRNFEYYSEDPLVSGKMAAAMVRGVQSNGVGAAIKHYAANNQETNRLTLDAKVSERALREIYLRGFEIAVKEAQPWTVMSAYNKVNGVDASQSAWLLTDVLRRDWGFAGFVMTDWNAGRNAVEQMQAGNDLLMPGNPRQMNAIIEAGRQGQLDEKVLDENVTNILGVIKKSHSFKGRPPSNKPDLRAHAALAREAASEGMVLLKNDSRTLPLAKGQTVAAFGIHSYDMVSGGTGSGDVNEAYTVSLPEGLRNAGLGLNADLQSIYEQYIETEKVKRPKRPPGLLGMMQPEKPLVEMAASAELIHASAATANLAVITIGRISGEFADRKTDDDYYLFPTEQVLIKNVTAAFHARRKQVIVILNTGGVIETASWRAQPDAILLTWLPGQEAGNAIADVLSGKVNPSGKLPSTFAVKYEDDPTAANFPGHEYGEPINMGFQIVRPAEVDYAEGVFVGYRAFDKQNIKPAYEFGYGLSYTTFAYSDMKLSSKDFKDKLTVSITVKNTGRVAGKEVAQLYLSAPHKTLDKPIAELKGFAKTRLLQPNEFQALSFELDARALASFDERNGNWLAEQGVYTVKIGASSRDIRLSRKFSLRKNLVTAR